MSIRDYPARLLRSLLLDPRDRMSVLTYAVDLRGPVPFVLLAPDPAPDLKTYPWPSEAQSRWSSLRPFMGFLKSELREFPRLSESRKGPSPYIPFLLIEAALLADRLAAGFGHATAFRSLAKNLPANWREAYCAHFAATRQNKKLEDDLAQITMRHFVPTHFENEAPFLFIGGAQETRVTRYSQSKEVVCERPLMTILAQIAAEFEEPLRLHAQAVAQRNAEVATAADRLLERYAPGLLPLLLSCRQFRSAGIPVLDFEVRPGIPAQIRIVAKDEHDCVEVQAVRAHEAFILGDSAGSLYFFPACQLVAPIGIFPDGLRLNYPKVRVPAGHGRFLHPYVGDMYDDVTQWPGSVSEPMCPMPEEHRRLLNTPVTRTTVAKSREMCLSGQDRVLAKLMPKSPASPTAPVDAAGIARELWDLLRRGLCYGHQHNRSAPRVGLNAEAMPYPLIPGQIPAGRLAQRVFPFGWSHGSVPQRTESELEAAPELF